MNSQYLWQTIIPLGIFTFIIRSSFVFLSNKIKISKRAEELFTFIPAAILPALFAPMVFHYNGDISYLLFKERVIALLVGGVIAFKTRNIFYSILAGLVSLYLIKNFF